MAFNWKTFQTRTLTAIVFAAVMLIGLLWNQWSFLVLFSIIHFGCWWEYFNLLEKIHKTTYHRYIRIGFMLMGYSIMLWFCGPVYEVNNYQLKENFAFPVSVAGFVMLALGIFLSKQIKLKAFGSAVLGLLYISLSWGLMIGLRNFILTNFYLSDMYVRFDSFDFFSPIIPIAIIFSIWVNDTMAYIVGSLIGKTPLSVISPKKTWEGTIGGIILSVIVIGLIFSNMDTSVVFPGFHFDFSKEFWYVLPAIASVFGTFGDLLESKLKRIAGVKDSGNIMPGHGGFLDRFDSLLLATPAVWVYLYFSI